MIQKIKIKESYVPGPSSPVILPLHSLLETRTKRRLRILDPYSPVSNDTDDLAMVLRGMFIDNLQMDPGSGRGRLILRNVFIVLGILE